MPDEFLWPSRAGNRNRDDRDQWVGIILCIIRGIDPMASGPGTVVKVSGLLLGLLFALFASPLITWARALQDLS